MSKRKPLDSIQCSSIQSQSGLPGYLYAERPFKIEDAVTNLVSTIDGKPRTVAKRKQLDDIKAMLKCDKPFTACIASKTNDLKAKVVAATLMLSVRRSHQDLQIKWHTLYGTYNDPLLKPRRRWSENGLLILSNVDVDSTDLKRETLRDILELNHSIPRIVVTRDCPITFFRRIGYPINYPIYIGKQLVRQGI